MAHAATDISHHRIQGDGVTLHVARSGQGPCVLLLHGFPEDWRSWKHQMPALASSGFSVLAPDLRGYNESDRPLHRGAYHMRHLVADVTAIVAASGCGRAHIVGHDWGAVVAWTFAGVHPELVNRLVILNGPHLEIYARLVRRPSKQALRAWYTVLFRIPWLAERLLSANGFALVRDLFGRRPALPAFSDAEIDGYVEALSRPGALTAALRWYRDNAAADAVRLARDARSRAPTLVIWGERDTALGLELLDGLDRVAPDLRIHRIPRASHWVQNEAPDEVNRVMIEFLTASPQASASASSAR
jgi:pimeloyl-ACP methyl ester carboxylesterase